MRQASAICTSYHNRWQGYNICLTTSSFVNLFGYNNSAFCCSSIGIDDAPLGRIFHPLRSSFFMRGLLPGLFLELDPKMDLFQVCRNNAMIIPLQLEKKAVRTSWFYEIRLMLLHGRESSCKAAVYKKRFQSFCHCRPCAFLMSLKI